MPYSCAAARGSKSITVPVSPLLTGLASYWKLEETTGDRLDSHATNNLTAIGATMTYATGKVGNAADLTRATPDYFTRASANLAGMPIGGAQSCTVTYWVYLHSYTTTNNYQMLVAYRTGTWQGNWKGFICLVRFDTGPHATLVYNGPINTTNAAVHGPTIPLNEWRFGSFQYDADNQRIRCQTNLADEDGWESLVGGIETMGDPTGGDLYIGEYDGLVAACGLDGLIDEVGIWDRCLSDAELAQLYNSGAGLAYPFS